MAQLKILVPVLFFLAIGLIILPVPTTAGGFGERISNGSFEEGFDYVGVGLNWKTFNNGGRALYGYQDDTDHLLVYDGTHSQLIEINTLHNNETDPERISGIYQTVALVAGQSYTLNIRGMIRILETDLDKDNWAYVVQWGMDPNGGSDWTKVSEWNVLPWQKTYLQIKPGDFLTYTTAIVAPSNKVTFFFAARKKFPIGNKLLDVNLDGISLFGQIPPGTGAPGLEVIPPTFVYTTKPFPVRVATADGIGVSELRLYDNGVLVTTEKHVAGPLNKQINLVWTPEVTGTRILTVQAINQVGKITTVTKTVEVVPIAEFARNGNFESGFDPTGIALGWGKFNNGGRGIIDAYYDDTWTPAVPEGKHAQLIEIWNLDSPEYDQAQLPDRYAGVCQVMGGVVSGASYYLSLSGLVRVSETEMNKDALKDWSYSAQWGYLPSADANCSAWTRVTNWQTMQWETQYRETPTKFYTYTAQIFAPSNNVTIYFRAWKKWPQGRREVLVNLDQISFMGYQPLPAPTPTPTSAKSSPTPTLAISATPTITATPTATK